MAEPRPHLIVGVDFSEHGETALRFAVDFCKHHHPEARVVAIHAWTYPWWMSLPIGVGTPETAWTSEHTELAEQRLEEMAQKIGEGSDLEVTTKVVEGNAAEVLIERSTDALAVVVGSRGHGAVERWMAGSTSSRVAGHAACPVIIVPDGCDQLLDRPVVIGIDGSDNSKIALDWAARHSAHTDTIKAVRTWTIVPEASMAHGSIDHGVLERDAVEGLAAAVDGCENIPSSVDVDQIVQSGDARTVLRSLAGAGSMLVVGARGRTALEHLMLGSVASWSVHHPVCPTVIVPTGQ